MVIEPSIPQQITLPDLLIEQMRKHAIANPGVEICGLIGSSNKEPLTVYPIKNISESNTSHFLMDPEEQIQAMRMMRDSGEEMWGIYHSHPFSSAWPSDVDQKMAYYSEIYYLVISLADELPEVGCFYFDGKDFIHVTIDNNQALE